MGAFKGRTVKNKSKARQEAKNIIAFNKQQEELKKLEGNPLLELVEQFKKEKPICRYCGAEAYKSDSEGYICEPMAYKGKCKPILKESVQSRLKIK